MGWFKKKKTSDLGKIIYDKEFAKTYGKERMAYAKEKAQADAKRLARGGNSKLERLGRVIGGTRKAGQLLFGDMDKRNKKMYSRGKPITKQKYIIIKGKAYKVGSKSRRKPVKRKKDTSMRDLIEWQP